MTGAVSFCDGFASRGTGGKPVDGKTAKVLKFLIVIIVVAIAGGAVFLATWDIPAPNHQVEKVIPNDRFTR